MKVESFNARFLVPAQAGTQSIVWLSYNGLDFSPHLQACWGALRGSDDISEPCLIRRGSIRNGKQVCPSLAEPQGKVGRMQFAGLENAQEN